MRGVAALALVGLALMTSGTLQAGTGPATSLRVAFWEGPGQEPDMVWTLRCNPAGGTLARAARACAKLERSGGKLFAPLRKDLVCTQIYGGPQRARIVGRVAGEPVWASFSRTDGCQIGRWNALAPWLLPPGGVT